MRVLCVGDEEAKSVASELEGSGFAARAMTDAEVLALTAMPPELQLVLVVSAEPSGVPELVRRLRGRLTGPSAGVLLVPVVEEGADSLVIETLAAGADADIRRPCSREVLVARVDALRKCAHVGYGGRPPRLTALPFKPPSRASIGALEAMALLPAWRVARSTLCVAASRFLLKSCEIAEPTAARAPTLACTVRLGDVQHELELVLSLSSDSSSARFLAGNMFGREGLELEADLLQELTNILMGAVKTAFTPTYPFASGVPEAVTPDAVQSQLFQIEQSFTLVTADARVLVRMGARSKGSLVVEAARLQEGMVLARDVFNGKGLLLINGGTRLSTTMVNRLRAMLAPQTPVEVMAA